MAVGDLSIQVTVPSVTSLLEVVVQDSKFTSDRLLMRPLFNFTLCVCAKFSHGEHWCASWCWCSPTWHTSQVASSQRSLMWCKRRWNSTTLKPVLCIFLEKGGMCKGIKNKHTIVTWRIFQNGQCHLADYLAAVRHQTWLKDHAIMVNLYVHELCILVDTCMLTNYIEL